VFVIERKRIGLFGGTFSPIHLGHLRGAEEVREAFALHEVIFIPAAIPPHKRAENVIEGKHRLEMVKRATRTNPSFSVSNAELERPGKSYSIDTLRHFQENHQDSVFFILGRDAFLEIETWMKFQSLFSLANFIVMTQPGSGKVSRKDQLPEALRSVFRYNSGDGCWIHTSDHTLHFKEIMFLDISSTRIRELIDRGQSVKYLVPGEVEGYIQEHDLYRRREHDGG